MATHEVRRGTGFMREKVTADVFGKPIEMTNRHALALEGMLRGLNRTEINSLFIENKGETPEDPVVKNRTSNALSELQHVLAKHGIYHEATYEDKKIT